MNKVRRKNISELASFICSLRDEVEEIMDEEQD